MFRLSRKLKESRLQEQQAQTRMSLSKEDLTAEKKQRLDVMLLVLAEAERNIKTAVADLQITAGKVSHSEYFAADVRKRTCE